MCRTTEFPSNSTDWEKSLSLEHGHETTSPCSTEGWGHECPTGEYCGNPLMIGMTIEDDGGYYDKKI